MPGVWHRIDGWFDFQDIYDGAVEQFASGSKFVEVGCWLGRSTCYLAEQVLSSGKDIRLTVIDSFQGVPGDELQELLVQYGGSVRQAFEANMRAAKVEHLITIIEENSGTAHRHFEPCSLDFVFIDGEHSYKAAKRDILNFRAKVRPGGILAGHDYGHSEEVRRAVDELLGPCPASKSSWAKRIT